MCHHWLPWSVWVPTKFKPNSNLVYFWQMVLFRNENIAESSRWHDVSWQGMLGRPWYNTLHHHTLEENQRQLSKILRHSRRQAKLSEFLEWQTFESWNKLSMHIKLNFVCSEKQIVNNLAMSEQMADTVTNFEFWAWVLLSIEGKNALSPVLNLHFDSQIYRNVMLVPTDMTWDCSRKASVMPGWYEEGWGNWTVSKLLIAESSDQIPSMIWEHRCRVVSSANLVPVEMHSNRHAEDTERTPLYGTPILQSDKSAFLGHSIIKMRFACGCVLWCHREDPIYTALSHLRTKICRGIMDTGSLLKSLVELNNWYLVCGICIAIHMYTDPFKELGCSILCCTLLIKLLPKLLLLELHVFFEAAVMVHRVWIHWLLSLM